MSRLNNLLLKHDIADIEEQLLYLAKFKDSITTAKYLIRLLAIRQKQSMSQAVEDCINDIDKGEFIKDADVEKKHNTKIALLLALKQLFDEGKSINEVI